MSGSSGAKHPSHALLFISLAFGILCLLMNVELKKLNTIMQSAQSLLFFLQTA